MADVYDDLLARKDVIKTCLAMNALRINQGTSGNISLRNPSGFLLTPSGVPYAEMQPAHIVQMDLDAGYTGDRLPSSEWRMHLDIYCTRPEAAAIVHTHSTYATALSTLGHDIPAFHYMIAVAGGADLRCAPYATFGTQELSDGMLAALEGRTACLLGNHGMICFGASLEKALWLAGEVETLSKQYFIACRAGEPRILDTEEMRKVLVRFKSYGKQREEMGEGGGAVEMPVHRTGSSKRQRNCP